LVVSEGRPADSGGERRRQTTTADGATAAGETEKRRTVKQRDYLRGLRLSHHHSAQPV